MASNDPTYRKHGPADIENETHGNNHKFAISNEQQELIISLLASGFTIRAALGRAGVPLQTFEDWMRKGGDVFSKSRYTLPVHLAVEPYKSFALRVRSAEAESEMAASVRIMESKDWRSHAWYLQRRFPDVWGVQMKAKNAASAVSREQEDNETPNGVKLYLPDNGRKLESIDNDNDDSED